MGFIAIVHLPDHTAGATDPDLWADVIVEHGRLVGVFNYPARRDLVDHPNCFVNGKAAWSRDRMGFMKCAVCGKRNKRVRRFLIEALFDFLGANLYLKAPAAFRTPDGYGVHADND